MKYYMVFVCIALASLNFKANCFPSRQSDNPCHDQPNGSFLNHPLGCKYFIVCNNGEVNTGSCPDGLAFNPLRPPCDLESNVDCSQFTTQSTTTHLPTTTTQSTTTRSTTTTRATTTTTTQSPTTTTQSPTTTTQPPTTTTQSPTTTTQSPTTTTQSPTTTTQSPTTTTQSPTTTTAQSTTTASTTSTTTSTTTQSTTRQTTTTTTTSTTTSRPTTITLPTTTPRPTLTTVTNSLPSTTVRPVTPEMPGNGEQLTCPDDDDPDKIVFLASNTHCSKYYICYHNKPIEMTCSPNLHWNIKTQKCDSIEETKCTVSTMPSFFPVCPRDEIRIYSHPLNCEWFLYCNFGHMTVQQCPFFYNFDSETQSCQLKTVAKCVLYSD